ncbi:anti-sigma factor antagonist [Streptomyces sp. NPDC008150]|uniref:STAS domain-containing protein n=1 Tax=Streptomyces sp. NPDC008150 TaxID=3364816 RepID=UPI0036F0A07C
MADTGGADGRDRLTITAGDSDGIVVLALVGEIDYDSGDLLRHALRGAEVRTPPRVVIDLRGVTFMDSSGINILIAAYRELTYLGGWLRMAALAPAIERTVQLVGVDSVIDCYPTLAEALAA